MRIAILHLSDIHLKTASDWVLKRVPSIHQAIRTIVDEATALFLVITGDIAFSGRSEEYEIAKEVLGTLTELMKKEYSAVEIQIVAVPGNHDCDFRDEESLRVALLSSGPRILDRMNPEDDSIARALTQPQDHFFQFLAEVESSSILHGYERLAYQRAFLINGKRIRFDCYNTAWMSRKNEEPSQLLFPIDSIDSFADGDDIVLSLFHHPTQWLEPTNARGFRARVEYRSNLILTGHEHVPDQYTKQHELSGEVTLYLEGAVLQGADPKESGFQTIEIDLESNEKRLTQYGWRRTIYVPSRSEWSPLQPPAQKQQSQLVNKTSYLSSLTDPGANFSHKSRRTLQLSDIYVYPDLMQMALDKAADRGVPIIDSEKVVEFVVNHRSLLIAGAEVSGKTALAKTLYGDLIPRGLAPLMLNGESIKVTGPRDVSKLIDKYIKDQYEAYEGDATTAYVQLAKDSRVLIIDDFHKTKLNRNGRTVFLKAAEAIFGRIIILVDAFFEFQEISQPPSDQSSLMRYTHSEISEFGHRLRYRLISKWVMFGQEYTGNEEEMRHTINETAEIVTTLLGRKMVPRYPVFIISMLQALDTNTNLNTASGAFGYFYEVFILQSLSLHRTPAITMDTIITFLTLVGHRMFELRQMFLTAREWEEVTTYYFDEYGLPFDRGAMMQILEGAKIIQQQNGNFEFKYKYVYYYFVSKHLATGLGSASQRKKARQLIVTMTKNLNVEAYAHIIMFLVYLTKDEKTISEILKRAREQYAEFESSDLDTDIQFLNALELDLPKVELTDGDVDEHKDARLRQIDHVERGFEANEDEINQNDYLERKIDDAIRMEVAGKTLIIAGQVLRNFPGALPRRQKSELTREIHLLGLRVLSMMLRSLDRHKDSFRNAFVDAVKELKKGTSETEISRQAEQLLFILGGILSFGILKLIATSIGSEHLREIYIEALKDTPEIPTRLVNLAIKLDHFRPFPEKEVNDLAKRIKDNKIALTHLQLLVRDHFHIEKEDFRLRQRICGTIGIDFRDYRMIEDKYKK